MRYTIKTIDGNRYELPSGVIPLMVKQYGHEWLMFESDGKTKYINITAVVSVTEKKADE